MKLIAHRGNTNGINRVRENSPDYIDEAIQKGFDVEIDLRIKLGVPYLGHDSPDHEINLMWLFQRKHKLWVHCKEPEALEFAIKNKLHCFWHDTDDYTLTSYGVIWAYPGKESTGNNTILVMPELNWSVEETKQKVCYGVCSDIVEQFKT